MSVSADAGWLGIEGEVSAVGLGIEAPPPPFEGL